MAPRLLLRKTFEVDHEEMVLQKDIAFASFCEHHLLPFSVGPTWPTFQLAAFVGLSKLARVVECCRKPQIQERLTQEIADLTPTRSRPRVASVAIEAAHRRRSGGCGSRTRSRDAAPPAVCTRRMRRPGTKSWGISTIPAQHTSGP